MPFISRLSAGGFSKGSGGWVRGREPGRPDTVTGSLSRKFACIRFRFPNKPFEIHSLGEAHAMKNHQGLKGKNRQRFGQEEICPESFFPTQYLG